MLDFSKPSSLVDDRNVTPQTVNFTMQYKVATSGKGRFVSLTSRFTAVDLDFLALLFNASNEVISVSGPQDPSPFPNSSIIHLGDGSARGGGSASETISLTPSGIPAAVKSIVFAVVAYGDAATFGKLSQLQLTIMSMAAPGAETVLADEYLSIEHGNEGQLMAKVQRDGDGWSIAPFIRPVGHASKWEQVANTARSALRASR